MRDLKYLTRPEKNLLHRHWRSVLVGALLVLLVPFTVLLVRKGAQAVSSWQSLRHHPAPAARPLPLGDELFRVADHLLSSASFRSDGVLTATADDGTLLSYTIDPDLQRRVEEYLTGTRPAYAVLVAIEPATGRLLALTGYSSLDPGWRQNAPYQVYPMASLFKMVTAAAALECRKITPSSVMEFRGRLVSETPGNWDPRPRGRNHRMDLTEAMGKSVNPVYGLIASDLLGSERLQQTCSRFGFNRSLLLPGVPAVPSSAPPAGTVQSLRLQGSGLDHELKVSPIHAAAITAGIANGGTLMAPRLVDRAERNGQPLPVPGARRLEQLVSPDVAGQLTSMLLTTVTSGTSSRAFRNHDGRRLLGTMQVAAKTGSISGDNPRGHYSWFAAYAPADRPQIALVALVINGDRWKIKASHLGERALTAFFRDRR